MNARPADASKFFNATDMETASFYLIEGRNGVVNFSNDFIKKFSFSGKILIDNDHGMITDLVEAKRRVEAGEDWLHLQS